MTYDANVTNGDSISDKVQSLTTSNDKSARLGTHTTPCSSNRA